MVAFSWVCIKASLERSLPRIVQFAWCFTCLGIASPFLTAMPSRLKPVFSFRDLIPARLLANTEHSLLRSAVLSFLSLSFVCLGVSHVQFNRI